MPDPHEYRVAFTPDGQTAFFGRGDEFFLESRQSTLYLTEFQNGAWSTPVVAPFSGIYSDIDPFVSSDGQRVYFSSIRPVNGQPRTDADLWVVERSGSGWGEAQNPRAVREQLAADLLIPVDTHEPVHEPEREHRQPRVAPAPWPTSCPRVGGRLESRRPGRGQDGRDHGLHRQKHADSIMRLFRTSGSPRHAASQPQPCSRVKFGDSGYTPTGPPAVACDWLAAATTVVAFDMRGRRWVGRFGRNG